MPTTFMFLHTLPNILELSSWPSHLTSPAPELAPRRGAAWSASAPLPVQSTSSAQKIWRMGQGIQDGNGGGGTG